MRNTITIKPFNSNIANFNRAIRLTNPAASHNNSDFKERFGTKQCALFAYAVGRAMLNASVRYSVTAVLENGTKPVHWYVCYNTHKTNKRAFIDAHGITYDESSIWNRLQLNPAEDDTGLYSFDLNEETHALSDLRHQVNQAVHRLPYDEIPNYFDEIVEQFGELMIAGLASDPKRTLMMYEALATESGSYCRWITSQKWFSELEKDNQTEIYDSIVGFSKACSKQKKPNLLWEYAVDHLMAGDFTPDTGPESWQWIYSIVDEFRTNCGVMSSDTNHQTPFNVIY